MHLTIRGSERVKECIFMAAFSQDKIRRVVSDMEHKSWKRKNNTGVPAEVIHHPGAGVEVPLLHFPLLEKTGIVKEGFTTRLGGVSEGIFSTMNLSFTRGDEEEAVRENYRRLASALDVDYDKFVFTDQTHTTNVRKVTAEDAGNGLTREREFHDIDGLITDVPGIVLSTFYADCVPLYFVDPVHRAIGLSHSGWRGTVNRMGKATIEAMRREYGSRPEELRCAIGPSICQDCYEVSGDVIEEFRAAFPETLHEKLFYGKPDGKYQLNLWEANHQILLAAGVPEKQIHLPNLCTCCNPDFLYSHRASKGKRGNLAAFLSLV